MLRNGQHQRGCLLALALAARKLAIAKTMGLQIISPAKVLARV